MQKAIHGIPENLFNMNIGLHVFHSPSLVFVLSIMEIVMEPVILAKYGMTNQPECMETVANALSIWKANDCKTVITNYLYI